ncbi:MAG TPA: tetratricopeptide repeat protein [Candidatus Krumholzibacteria bacterium]|nr:tetratricopeptide repeat protein [Candidatus Krumholzibacteria bacterium]
MSKATIVRKKALDLVRQQDWQGAIREYKRLVEMDQSNPNVHNELADIYLKTSSRTEAYDCFVRAIDEYTRVGLYNNAVAVAKKVMRVLPARTEVLTLLGNVRMKQGLMREAESYYVSFLEKVAGGSIDAEVFKKIAREMAESAPESVPVLHKLSQCLLSLQLDEEAGDVLIRLHALLERNGDTATITAVRGSIDKLGIAARLPAAKTGGSPDAGRTVVTEENIWTNSHTAGERIEIESTPRFSPPDTGAAAPAAPAASNGPSERELYLLRLARGVGGSATKREPEPENPPAEPVAPAASVIAPEPPGEVHAAPVADDMPEHAEEAPEAAAATATMPQPAPKPSAAPRAASPASKPSAGDHTQISAVIDEGSGDGQGEDDYRSHYDLGMAYMEMDLLPEAIREYQAAARSPQFQVKCLEMIGLCFVRQNQPQLAIKQLNKGLAIIGSDSEESLGMKYNLGLAYEMVGDFAAARALFEDVYVVDVTFRDVAEKMARLAAKP